CKDCPLRTQCIGKSDFKKIEDSIDKPLYDEMHARLQSAKAKRMAKLRSSTVEPVLGTLINFMGMRRIWTRGIAGATKFLLGAAIAYNLKKWMKFKERKTKVAVMMKELPKKAEKMMKNDLFFFYRPCYTPVSMV
ncbi:MAG: transposase, partial [Flavobacteriales bacterium]|nr:transposase [Flavobacteriales bacterium]